MFAQEAVVDRLEVSERAAAERPSVEEGALQTLEREEREPWRLVDNAAPVVDRLVELAAEVEDVAEREMGRDARAVELERLAQLLAHVGAFAVAEHLTRGPGSVQGEPGRALPRAVLLPDVLADGERLLPLAAALREGRDAVACAGIERETFDVREDLAGPLGLAEREEVLREALADARLQGRGEVRAHEEAAMDLVGVLRLPVPAVEVAEPQVRVDVPGVVAHGVLQGIERAAVVAVDERGEPTDVGRLPRPEPMRAPPLAQDQEGDERRDAEEDDEERRRAHRPTRGARGERSIASDSSSSSSGRLRRSVSSRSSARFVRFSERIVP